MKTIKLFEEWVGDNKVPNPLAESICKTLDRFKIDWTDLSSKKQKAQGGVTINISYEEGLKFIKSDYFSEEVLKQMKPYVRDLVEIVRGISNMPQISGGMIDRPGGNPKRGITFIIYSRGAIRLWLDFYKKVSSNDNVEIDPSDPADVLRGTFKFLTRTLIFNLEGVIINKVTANLTSDDLINLRNTSLKNERLFHSLTRMAQISGIPNQVFSRMIKLNKSSISRMWRLAEVAPTLELLTQVVDIVNPSQLDRGDLHIFADRVLSNPNCNADLVEIVSDFAKESDLVKALADMDLPSVDLKRLYFSDLTTSRVKEIIKSNPNFGDIIGDEGGIFSDWL
jgi:hypothetical protein